MSTRAPDTRTQAAPEVATVARPSLTPARGLALHRRCACGGDAGHGATCESCAQKDTPLQRKPEPGALLQRRDDGGAGGGIPSSVQQTLSQPGRPLDSGTREAMESRFGEDFSGVRVHDDSAAAQSARDVHAHAYTVGESIVFAPGQYQPHSESGQHLLAHELAHTVQQRGLQRSGISNLADQGPEYRRLEAEADRAADFAMRGGGGAFGHGLHSASVPTLSRAGTGTAIPSTGTAAAETATEEGESVEITVESAYMTTRHLVTPIGGFSRGGTEQAFAVDKIFVPATKGPRALDFYAPAARGGSLIAVLSTGEIRSEEWQVRADTDALRARWLQAVGWTTANANERWQAVGGDATFPLVNTATCQMDHIVELQISGNNSTENIQALDGTQNRDSGGAIKNQVFGLARRIKADPRLVAPNSAAQLQLRFRTAELVGSRGRATPEPLPTTIPPAARTCLSVEICARNATRIAAGVGAAAGAETPEMFPVSAGGTSSSARVPTGFTDGRGAASVTLLGDSFNNPSAELISGLLLKDLRRAADGTKTVTAKVDTRDGTRVPLTLVNDTAGIVFDVQALSGGAHPLRLSDASRRANIEFTYPYLSPGTITSFERLPNGTVNWSGEIRPTIPLLPSRLLVNYRDGAFRVGMPLDRRAPSNAIPGFTVTEATLELQLAPTLSATGHLAFSMGSGARPVATGTVDIGADSTGLTATGQVRINVPGVDEVSGTINFRNGAWSGQIVIESTQIRIPNVQRGRLQLDVDSTGVRPSGEVELLLPRNLGTATLGLTRTAGRFVYSLRGRITVPGLREVDVTGSYDGTTLTANARNIGFTWNGLEGTIDVTYTQRGDTPGRITGTGRLTIARGGARGSIAVTLNDSGRFSGRGDVSYPLNIHGTRINASAAIIVDENQNVRVEGALRLPQPIQLFRSFGSERQLFNFRQGFPIPALSIPPLGVQAVIEAGVSAGYSFGPGELRNVAIEAAFNPLAERVNPRISFHCDLHIPASASISAMIGGGLGLEAGLGRVTGTLRVTATLRLQAVAGGPLDVLYENEVFSITARPGIDASLNLGLALDANARAELGIGPLAIGIEKTWNLGRRDIVLGRFSVHAPISYSSNAGFNAPSIDELEWGPPPEINVPDLINQLVHGAAATESGRE